MWVQTDYQRSTELEIVKRVDGDVDDLSYNRKKERNVKERKEEEKKSGAR